MTPSIIEFCFVVKLIQMWCGTLKLEVDNWAIDDTMRFLTKNGGKNLTKKKQYRYLKLFCFLRNKKTSINLCNCISIVYSSVSIFKMNSRCYFKINQNKQSKLWAGGRRWVTVTVRGAQWFSPSSFLLLVSWGWTKVRESTSYRTKLLSKKMERTSNSHQQLQQRHFCAQKLFWKSPVKPDPAEQIQ